MGNSRLLGALVAAMLALGLLAFGWMLAAGPSEAQSGSMHNCPLAGKWSIAVWEGQSGTAATNALATCGVGVVGAAYSLDPQTGDWSRWFAGKPDVTNLAPLNDMQGVLALGSATGPVATRTPTPAATPAPTSTPPSTPLPGLPQPGVWTGTTSEGKDIWFEVVDGTQGTRGIRRSAWLARGTDCSLYVHIEDLDTFWPIVGDAFSYSEERQMDVSGTFDSATTASGDLFIHPMMDCTTHRVTWTASAQQGTGALQAEGVVPAQEPGQLRNCPRAGKWSIAVWEGDDGAAVDAALASCGAGSMVAAYSLDSQTGAWSRWFAGKPDVSNLPPLNDKQGVLALGRAPTATPTPVATATMLPTATPTTVPIEGEPELGTWRGTTSQGKPLEFDVVGGSRTIARIKFEVKGTVSGGTCDDTVEISDGTVAAIVDNAFSFSWAEAGVSISGVFDSTKTASGDLDYNSSPYDPDRSCVSGPLTWTASH